MDELFVSFDFVPDFDSSPSPTDSLISLSYLMVAFSANSFIHFCGDTYYSNTPDSNTVLPNLSPWLEWSIPYGPCFYAMSLMNFWSIGRTFLLTSEDGSNKILVITIIELEARPRIGTDVLMLLVGTLQGQIVKNGHCSNYFGRTAQPPLHSIISSSWMPIQFMTLF